MTTLRPNPVDLPEPIFVATQIAAPLALEVAVLRGDIQQKFMKDAARLRTYQRETALRGALKELGTAFDITTLSAWFGRTVIAAHNALRARGGDGGGDSSGNAYYFARMANRYALNTLADGPWEARWEVRRAPVSHYLDGRLDDVVLGALVTLDEELRNDRYRMLLEFPEAFKEFARETVAAVDARIR